MKKSLDYFGFATSCVFFEQAHCQGADERYCERSDREGYDPDCKECDKFCDIKEARRLVEKMQDKEDGHD